jgi:tetratricopeptide (TPR) repeat protein
MKRRRIAVRTILSLAILLAAGAFTLTAQNYTVVFYTGEVDLIDGTQAIPVAIGDILSPADTVAVATGSNLEIDFSGSRILINAPGSYSIGVLAGAAGGSGTNRGIMRSLSTRIDELREGGVRDSTAIAGVRADDQASDEIDWVGDETVELWQEGFYLLDVGDLDEAFLAFGEAYDFAEAAERSEAAYYYGYAAALIGDYDEADRVYRADPLTRADGEIYYLFLISRADVAIHLGRYESAAADCRAALEASDILAPIHRQIAEYHLATALQGSGRGSESRSALRRVVSIGADPGLTRAAEVMLGL